MSRFKEVGVLAYSKSQLEKIEKKILGRVGKTVKFTYPKGEGEYYGKLKARCVLYAPFYMG